MRAGSAAWVGTWAFCSLYILFHGSMVFFISIYIYRYKRVIWVSLITKLPPKIVLYL